MFGGFCRPTVLAPCNGVSHDPPLPLRRPRRNPISRRGPTRRDSVAASARRSPRLGPPHRPAARPRRPPRRHLRDRRPRQPAPCRPTLRNGDPVTAARSCPRARRSSCCSTMKSRWPALTTSPPASAPSLKSWPTVAAALDRIASPTPVGSPWRSYSAAARSAANGTW